MFFLRKKLEFYEIIKLGTERVRKKPEVLPTRFDHNIITVCNKLFARTLYEGTRASRIA
jgi:hypothetical protein